MSAVFVGGVIHELRANIGGRVLELSFAESDEGQVELVDWFGKRAKELLVAHNKRGGSK